MLIDICLPVYNEEKILKKNADRIFDYCCKADFLFEWRIIIINNGSSDKTPEICEGIASERMLIKIITEPGRGRALKTYWQESPADIVLYMDIDLAVSLEHINELISPLTENGYDLTFGSRLLPASRIERSFIRELSSRTYNMLSRIMLGHEYSDLQCGFKAIRKEKFLDIAGQIEDPGWFFDTELIAFANHAGFNIKEIPVNWEENRWDQRKSKVNLIKDSLKFMKNLARLRMRLNALRENREFMTIDIVSEND